MPTEIDRTIAEMLELVDAEGWAEQHLAASPEFRTTFGTCVRRYGSAVAIITRHADIPALNRVFGLGVREALTPKALDGIIPDFREEGVKRLVVHWSPLSLPADGSAWLLAREFVPLRRMTKLYRRTETELEAPTSLRIIQIDGADANAYQRVVAPANELSPELAPHVRATLGQPGWRHYLAMDGARPVAGAALFVREQVAWCAASGTQPEHRGRGAQSALLARRVRDAAIMGCEWIVAESLEETDTEGNPSYRNMRRLGFEVAYFRSSYLLTFAPAGTATS